MLIDLYKHWSPAKDERSARTVWAWPELHPWWWLKPCRSLCDLGCGTGNMVQKLRGMGHEVCGITYQEEELGLDGVHLGDMHAPPFPDATFDGVVIWDSLEHCLSPFIALAEARRITRPGGHGLIFMPGQCWVAAPYHVHVMTIPQMQQLLTLTGWRIDTIVDCGDKQPGAAFYCVENPV